MEIDELREEDILDMSTSNSEFTSMDGSSSNSNSNDNDDESKNKPSTSESSLLASISSNIFKYFNDLNNGKENARLEATYSLIQQIRNNKNLEAKKKELLYTLKRMIRGCGASSNLSRACFFTSLVALLKSFRLQELTSTEIFDTMSKELQTGNKIACREDADAITGKLLVCAALMHTEERIQEQECFENLIKTLLYGTKHRSYHISMSYGLLNEIIQLSVSSSESSERFIKVAWPLLMEQLNTTWAKQTIHTIYCWLLVKKHYPQLKISKKKLNFYEKTNGINKNDDFLLNAESYKHLHRIFWQETKIDSILHPAYEEFAIYITKSKELKAFWLVVDKNLEETNKVNELVTIKMLTYIFENLECKSDDNNGLTPLDFLTPNFMKLFTNGLKASKNRVIKKNDATTISSIMKIIHKDFIQALIVFYEKLSDKNRVELIKCLIMPPFGIFNIEKYIENRLIHSFIYALETEASIKELYVIYKNAFKNGDIGLKAIECEQKTEAESDAEKDMPSTTTLLNVDRLSAGYILQHLLQHKSVSLTYNWRRKELEDFMINGIFYVNDTKEICQKKKASSFSKHFGEQCKQIFYVCLENRYIDLLQEQKLLQKLVELCNDKLIKSMKSKRFNVKYLRLNKLDEDLQNSWQLMYQFIEENPVNFKESLKLFSSKSKLLCVFHIFLMHMGLQLFRETEMAIVAIDDLINCMKRIKFQQISEIEVKKICGSTKIEKINVDKSTNSLKEVSNNDDEPLWIEVVIDLILHLLSQNNHTLRQLVNTIFPHICDCLSTTALNQILSMLDMKSGLNPLLESNNNSDEEDVDDDNDENDEKNENESDRTTDEEEDDDEDDTEDDSNLEDDTDITDNDKLRSAISQVLIENGAAPVFPKKGNTDDYSDNDDSNSIDLNNVTEEQGRKLDEALALAFKSMKRTNGTANARKKSKRYRIEKTTLMHFRSRVLDLLDIFIQHQLRAIVSAKGNYDIIKLVEVMSALFRMHQHCDDTSTPLQNKIEKILTKLTSTPHHQVRNSILQADNKLATNQETSTENSKIDKRQYLSISIENEKELIDYLRNLILFKPLEIHYEVINRLRNKCIRFLLLQLDSLLVVNYNGKEEHLAKLLKGLLEENIKEFITSRNTTVHSSLLSDILYMRWFGVRSLIITLIDNGLQCNIRIYRRIQVLEIVRGFYSNCEIVQQKFDTKNECSKYLHSIEQYIQSYIKHLLTDASCELPTRAGSTNIQAVESTNENIWKTSLKEIDVCLELMISIYMFYKRININDNNNKDNLNQVHFKSLLLSKDFIDFTIDTVQKRFKEFVTSTTTFKRFYLIFTINSDNGSTTLIQKHVNEKISSTTNAFHQEKTNKGKKRNQTEIEQQLVNSEAKGEQKLGSAIKRQKHKQND